MELLGYALALLLGFSLGAFGAGGSILSVPILVYLFGIKAEFATAYSLFIVGVVALVGTIKKLRSHEIYFSQSLAFALCTTLGVFFARKFIIYTIPLHLDLLLFELSRRSLILGVFSLVMLSSSFLMLKRKDRIHLKAPPGKNSPFVYPCGVLIGLLAGFVGAGGGFLIVPFLNLVLKFPIKNAMATSLFVIAFQSLFGVLGEWKQFPGFNFLLISKFILIAIFGMLYGQRWSRHSSALRLKKVFAYFIIFMAFFILFKEFTN